jgi:TrfB plasmid transcriptional repressor
MRRPILIPQEQFDSALATYLAHQPEGLRHGGKAQEVAQKVLVLGVPQADVARQHKMTRQQVSTIVKRFRQLLSDAEAVPHGWISDTVTLPPDEWPHVRAIEARARERYAQAPNPQLTPTGPVLPKPKRQRRPPGRSS